MLGQQMTLVAVPYQVYRLTGSSLLVGVTSIVALVPLIVFGLLGGAIADAMDRRKLMLITSSGAAVTSALLAVQALLPGGGNLAVLWVLTACVSGFAAVNQPTRAAVIPAVVGPSGVAAANALSMTCGRPASSSGRCWPGPDRAGRPVPHLRRRRRRLPGGDDAAARAAAVVARGPSSGCGSAPPCAGWARASPSCAPSRCCS